VGLPYQTILRLACVVLAGRYVFDREGSPAGRWIVGLATAASFALPSGVAWTVLGVLTQVTVCLFVLFREVANRP
jgi:hypothetical protein